MTIKSKLKSWNKINWHKAVKRLRVKQANLVVAYKSNNWKEVYRQQNALLVSFEARAMAVRRVTQNKGKDTPGHDGITWRDPQSKLQAVKDLRAIVVRKHRKYRSGAIRRTWIPKGNSGEVRPLGIPNMIDRALQTLVKLSLDPIVEQTSDFHSYGFRTYRSSHDAVTRIRHILDKPWGPRWVWDADIEKCFDEINHEFLLELVRPILCRKGFWMVEQWLKAPIWDKGSIFKPKKGTPQGGAISPLLCNIVLNGLEKVVRGEYANSYNPELKGCWVVRYADDLIITGQTRDKLELEIIPKVSSFLKQRGLRVSKRKSRLVNVVQEGFDFLGWNIRRRKYNYRLNDIKHSKEKTVLIMMPTKESRKNVIKAVKSKFSLEKPMDGIIRDVNPVIRGWTNYYRCSPHSKRSFYRLQTQVYDTFWRWAQRKHRKQNKRWIYLKYFVKTKRRSWTIRGTPGIHLFDAGLASIYKHRSLKVGINPYVDADYYISRTRILEAERFRQQIYRKWKWKCALCEGPLYGEERVELHHIIPAKDGGKFNLKNIVPVHKMCHDSITYGNKTISQEVGE